jgi:Photosynthetic reaction centre cytochrome C subunit
MKKSNSVSILCGGVLTTFYCTGSKTISKNAQEETGNILKERASFIKEVNNSIKGKENTTADSVYKNLQYIGGFEASLLPEIMDEWSIALGVSCTHCHYTTKWESDEKPEKHIARQMAEFSFIVSKEVRKIEGLKSVKPTVNCITCHKGKIKSALK